MGRNIQGSHKRPSDVGASVHSQPPQGSNVRAGDLGIAPSFTDDETSLSYTQPGPTDEQVNSDGKIAAANLFAAVPDTYAGMGAAPNRKKKGHKVQL